MADQTGNINPSKNIQKNNSNSRGRRRSSNSTLPCPTCGQLYSRRDNLKVHQRVHSGEKPFMCDECGARFRWIGVLRAHQATHLSRSKAEDEIGERTGSSGIQSSVASASRGSQLEHNPVGGNYHTISSSQPEISSIQMGPKDMSIQNDESEEQTLSGKTR